MHTEKVTIVQYDEDNDAVEEEATMIFNNLPTSAKGVMITLTEKGKLIIWRKKR